MQKDNKSNGKSDDSSVVISEHEKPRPKLSLEDWLVVSETPTVEVIDLESDHGTASKELTSKVAELTASTHPTNGKWWGQAPVQTNWWSTKVSYQRVTLKIDTVNGIETVIAEASWPHKTVEVTDEQGTVVQTVNVDIHNGRPFTTERIEKELVKLGSNWLIWGTEIKPVDLTAFKRIPLYKDATVKSKRSSYRIDLTTTNELNMLVKLAEIEPGFAKMVRNIIPQGDYFYEAEAEWLVAYTEHVEEVIINNAIREELANNPHDYLLTSTVTVDVEAVIEHTVRQHHWQVRKNKHPWNDRFQNVVAKVTIPMEFEVQHVFKHKQGMPQPRTDTKVIKTHDLQPYAKVHSGNSFYREVTKTLGVLDHVTKQNTVTIDTKIARQLLAGAGNNSDAIRKAIRPFLTKGGSIDGETFSKARDNLKEVCLAHNFMEYYRGFMVYAIRKNTMNTEHGKLKGTSYSPTYSAFRHDLRDTFVEYPVDKDFDISALITVLRGLKDENVTDLINLLDCLQDEGFFKVGSPILTAINAGLVDSAYRAIFSSQVSKYREIGKKREDKKGQRKEPTVSPEQRERMKTTVLRNAAVPFMNIKAPAVELSRSAIMTGSQMSMVELADRVLTQANRIIRRIAPSNGIIEHITIRRRTVTANRDGTIRSLVMPANRVLRRQQIRFTQDSDDEFTSVSVTWVPAMQYKLKEVEQEQEELPVIRKKFVWGKMDYRYSRETVVTPSTRLEVGKHWPGSAADPRLRCDWFMFEWNKDAPYHNELLQAFSSVATIGLDEDSVLVCDEFPNANGIFDLIEVNSVFIQDIVRELMKFMRFSQDWNTDRMHVIVDLEDIVNIRDYRNFRNVPADRRPKDFPRYFEKKRPGYDTDIAEAVEANTLELGLPSYRSQDDMSISSGEVNKEV